MFRCLIITIFVLIANLSFSQMDFRSGYVVLQSGDTIIGDVEFLQSKIAFKKCSFRKKYESAVTVYTPNQIAGYGFLSDKVFISKSITVKNENTVVFMEVLVQGFVSLYKFEDRFWIKKSEKEFFELTDIEKEVIVNGQTKLKRDREYRGQVNILMHDCAQIKSRIEKLNLYEKDITLLVEDYNHCKGNISTTFKSSKPWTKAVTIFQAGLNLSILNVDDSQPSYLRGQYDLSSSLMVGVGFDFYFPRVVNEKLALHIGAIYNDSKHSKSINEFNQMIVTIQQLKLPLGLRYTFSERNTTPFITGGISYSLHLGKEAAYVSNGASLLMNEVLANNQFGLWTSMGFKKSISKKLNGSLELRYERSNGAYASGSITNNIQLVLGIIIK